MRKITQHIIHCSDSENGNVTQIRKWHKAKGWHDVGYHFVIRPDGEVEVGRPLQKIGAHCKGHNATSVGTCLVGKEKFNLEQFESLRFLHHTLQQLFPGIAAFPHTHFNPHKTCPNFDVQKALERKK